MMRFIIRMISVTYLIGLIACTASSPVQQVHTQHDVRYSLWWAKLHDPTLNQLIDQALQHNNQVLTAKARVLQAQAQLKAAYDVWLPTLNVSASGFTAQGWDTHLTPQGGLAAIPSLAQLNDIKINGAYTGFVPTYSVNFLENKNNTQLARASLEEQRALYYAMRLSIISQTSGAYFSLLGEKEQYKEQQRYLLHLKQLVSLERVRYHDGASDLSMITQLEQTIADAQVQLMSIEYSVVQLQNTLHLLTNHDLGDIATKKQVTQIKTEHLIPTPLPADVLQHRPDLMQAQEQLNQAKAQIGLSYSVFFPQISLTGLLGGSSLELIHLLKLSTGLGLAQAAARMSVFNAAAYQHINAAKAGEKAAYYQYMHVLRSALVDVDNSLTHYKKNRDASMYCMQAYRAARQNEELVFARYQVGLQDKRSFLNAQLKTDLAALTCTAAKVDEFNSLVLVYQAVGGEGNRSA